MTGVDRCKEGGRRQMFYPSLTLSLGQWPHTFTKPQHLTYSSLNSRTSCIQATAYSLCVCVCVRISEKVRCWQRWWADSINDCPLRYILQTHCPYGKPNAYLHLISIFKLQQAPPDHKHTHTHTHTAGRWVRKDSSGSLKQETGECVSNIWQSLSYQKCCQNNRASAAALKTRSHFLQRSHKKESQENPRRKRNRLPVCRRAVKLTLKAGGKPWICCRGNRTCYTITINAF